MTYSDSGRGRGLWGGWLRLGAAVMTLALLALPMTAQAQEGPQPTPGPVALREVRFDPHLDTQLPLDLTLHDETGRTVTLRDYFGAKPVVLTFNYYDCQDLCPLVLNNLADIMVQVPLRLGQDYAAVTVSINPNNSAQDAAQMRDTVLHRYNRVDAPGAPQSWHFLTADQDVITKLTQAAGFHYAYDAALKDYAHPVGVMLLTPGGRIARYLYGMDFPPNDLRLGLVEASQSKIGTPVDAVLLLCYHYNPTTGRYSAAALNAVRAGGVLTLGALGTFLALMWRRELKGPKNPPTPPGLAG